MGRKGRGPEAVRIGRTCPLEVHAHGRIHTGIHRHQARSTIWASAYQTVTPSELDLGLLATLLPCTTDFVAILLAP